MWNSDAPPPTVTRPAALSTAISAIPRRSITTSLDCEKPSRRQRRRVGQRERCNGLHGKGDAERVCWRKFLDLKRMFHGSHLLAVSPRAPDRKTLDITIDCCDNF
jgi:hypothetical protein